MTQRYQFVLSRPVGASLEAFSQALLGPTAKALERFRPQALTIDVALPPDSGAALNAKREGDGAILSGLVSATLLDTLLTPLMFWLFGAAPLQRLLDESTDEVA